VEVNLLLSCTIEVLQLLINQYDNNKIDHKFFVENVGLKVKFLKDHLEYIKDETEISTAKLIIDRCDEILKKY